MSNPDALNSFSSSTVPKSDNSLLEIGSFGKVRCAKILKCSFLSYLQTFVNRLLVPSRKRCVAISRGPKSVLNKIMERSRSCRPVSRLELNAKL